ncbi:hypothetical protein NPX13_g8997 [Xylaria arbuscula]|uniref:Uncharacterized protein n=1 Tax=Xylaria arbuscula TaxID=114810 RepID=A0A9W8N7L8_9PEZI|nr:hypothetical protein NPX13_g8997 [Xylaria arbuscula]
MSTLQAPTPPNFHAIWARHHQPQIPGPPQQQQPMRDVSSLHPVFFTGRLQRSGSVPPAAAAAAAANGLHPVAHGYVYRDERVMRQPGGPML